MRHELKQKRAGFNLLAALPEAIGSKQELSDIFSTAINAINSNLGMDKTIVLYPTNLENEYSPSLFLGNGLHEEQLKNYRLEISPEYLKSNLVTIVSKSVEKNDFFKKISEYFDLPFFVVFPVKMKDQVIGVIISGRMLEARPLYPPLDQGDADSFTAISTLITATFEAMKVAGLRETDRLKTEFFANISHEFRTPITLTIGPLEALISSKYGEIPPRVAREAEVMLRNQRRLLDLVNQILDLAKLESGEMKLICGNLKKLNDFLIQRIEQFRPLAEKRGLELLTDFDDFANKADFYCDIEKFDKVIFNLLSNSIKFTQKGSVILSTLIENGTLIIQVIDTGMGIKTDQIPHIFDRFRQADGSRSREFAGTGIGLSLVKEVVELHGGSISVRSEYGIGTTFQIKFFLGKEHLPANTVFEDIANLNMNLSGAPLEIQEGKASTEELEKVEKQNLMVLSNRKSELSSILYVDDNADLRRFVFDLLKDDFNTYLAVNGQHGIEKLRQFNVDLILSDLMMPIMTGSEFLKYVKLDPLLNEIPFVMLTAKSEISSKVDELKMGVDEYLTKPFSEAELRARIANLLKLRRQQSRIKRDLIAARQIQQSLLPPRQYSDDPYSIEVLYNPSEELSGDFFEIKKINNKILFYVADVTSHGTASAQITYFLKGLFNHLCNEQSDLSSIRKIVKELANQYCQYNFAYSVAIAFGALDVETGKIEIVLSNFPNPAKWDGKKIENLDCPSNQVIDAEFYDKNIEFESEIVFLDKGEQLYFYTDGSYEFTINNSERNFGERGLTKLLAKNILVPNWSQVTLDELRKTYGAGKFNDDVTILKLSRN